jgi:fermentation-respiration switch protein FrsA (DUF1100 family)
MSSSGPWTLRRPLKRRWIRVVVSIGVLWFTIVVTMVLFEESLIFFPDRYPSGLWDVDAVADGSGCSIEDHFFVAEDGVRLHAWWCRPMDGAPSDASAVLLWFHGNAGNLSQRADLMLELARLGLEIVIVDYRGYGRSEGRPTEKGLYRDARGAWRHVVQDSGVDPRRIVILGKSLGGAVAVDLAADVMPAGLIVESSFTSVPDMAAEHYPFIPRWLIRTRMASIEKIGRVSCPVMVVHSPADEIVPFEHGRRLCDAVRGDRRFLEIPGAAHNELWLVGGERYFAAVRDFIDHCRSSAARGN